MGARELAEAAVAKRALAGDPPLSNHDSLPAVPNEEGIVEREAVAECTVIAPYHELEAVQLGNVRMQTIRLEAANA